MYEPVYGTTSSVLSPVQLQDSYLSLHSYQTSRYEGSKLISLEYNTYTSSSYTSSDSFTSLYGDKSYGKTAAIDHYVRKIGLFTQIESSSYLPLRNNVTIKYLVDEFGNLTELNQQNKHWEEIQNTFKANNDLNVSLFDNKKFGNQKLTEGNKDIFDSGYSYSPILYATGSCIIDSELFFENTELPTAYLSKANNSLSPFFISGSTTNQYPLISSGSVFVVSNLFNNEIQDDGYFSPGGATINNFPSYSVQETAPHSINASFNFDIIVNSDSINTTVWALQAWVSGSTRNQLIDSISKTFYTGNPVTPMTLAYVNSASPSDVCVCPGQPISAQISSLFLSTPSLQPGVTIVYQDEIGTRLTGFTYIAEHPTEGNTIYIINSSDGKLGNAVGTCLSCF